MAGIATIVARAEPVNRNLRMMNLLGFASAAKRMGRRYVPGNRGFAEQCQRSAHPLALDCRRFSSIGACMTSSIGRLVAGFLVFTASAAPQRVIAQPVDPAVEDLVLAGRILANG